MLDDFVDGEALGPYEAPRQIRMDGAGGVDRGVAAAYVPGVDLFGARP